jgi:hypothetical protein
MRVRRAEISGDEVWAVRWMRRRVSFIGTHLSGEVDNDEGAEKHGDNSNLTPGRDIPLMAKTI